MDVLEMKRDLSLPVPPIVLPEGYSIVAINEENGHLWEQVMDASWGNHQSGAFRYCISNIFTRLKTQRKYTALMNVILSRVYIHKSSERIFVW